MKLSEACGIVDDGRACLPANGEATSVISGAWWETTLHSERSGLELPLPPPQRTDQRADPLILRQLEKKQNKKKLSHSKVNRKRALVITSSRAVLSNTKIIEKCNLKTRQAQYSVVNIFFCSFKFHPFEPPVLAVCSLAPLPAFPPFFPLLCSLLPCPEHLFEIQDWCSETAITYITDLSLSRLFVFLPSLFSLIYCPITPFLFNR